MLHLNIIRSNNELVSNPPLSPGDSSRPKKPHISKHSRDTFILKSIEKYGDICDYSQIFNTDVQTVRSKITLICKLCNHAWTGTIYSHLYGKAQSPCPVCNKRIKASNTQKRTKWTFENLIIKSKEIYGSIYDYSDNDPNLVNNSSAEIKIKCTICDYQWKSNVNHHINGKVGCSSCSERLRWTFDRFLLEAKVIHGEKYNYSLINKQIIWNTKSRIDIICLDCPYQWSTSLASHIYNKRGCPNCSKRAKWTKETFIQRACEIHNNKYDYSDITENTIKNAYSRVSISCNTCKYKWDCNIHNHISGKTGCPKCNKRLKWTFDEFVKAASLIHENKYSYYEYTPVTSGKSKVSVICNTCDFISNHKIKDHIYKKTGCLSCSKRTPLSKEYFITRAMEIHGDMYDYSLTNISSEDTTSSYVNILCTVCKNTWTSRINNHLYGKRGCPTCKMSKGESFSKVYLDNNNIFYTRQKELYSLPKKRYDFEIFHGPSKYLYEFDGPQHFKYIPFFHDDVEDFHAKQELDVIKTVNALNEGYNIIRIDYKQINNIAFHLENALKLNLRVYFSSNDMYKHITERINF